MAESIRLSHLICSEDSETRVSISFLVSVTVGAEAQRMASSPISLTSPIGVGFNFVYTNVRGLI